LSENGVVRGDRQVAHDVEHVAAANGVAGHERNHDLGIERMSFCRSSTLRRGTPASST